MTLFHACCVRTGVCVPRASSSVFSVYKKVLALALSVFFLPAACRARCNRFKKKKERPKGRCENEHCTWQIQLVGELTILMSPFWHKCSLCETNLYLWSLLAIRSNEYCRRLLTMFGRSIEDTNCGTFELRAFVVHFTPKVYSQILKIEIRSKCSVDSNMFASAKCANEGNVMGAQNWCLFICHNKIILKICSQHAHASCPELSRIAENVMLP